MRIACISDTHNRHERINAFHNVDSFGEPKSALKGDLIIHAGDATFTGSEESLKNFLNWYSRLDFKHKIFVPGNHDWGCETNPELYKQMCRHRNIILLNHEAVEIEGVKIFGSPYTPAFNNWAFNAGSTITEAAHLRKPFIGDLWATIPTDINILVTHGPPYDILDESHDGRFLGCVELRKVVESIKPDLHFFGHIHHSAGQKHVNGTSYYNASICDEMYLTSNPVTIVEYP